MAWIVDIHNDVTKQLPKLPAKIIDRLEILIAEIEVFGPVRGNWDSYGKLTRIKHHCHLKKGRPTYVAVWAEDKKNITVEVVYVGTHENAPY